MKNLTEFINEAITKQLADLFDLSDANNFKVWFTSYDINNGKILNALNEPCVWDDLKMKMIEKYGGNSQQSQLYKGGVNSGMYGTLKQIGEDEISKTSVIANILRLIGRIKISNQNSVRGVVSAIRKALSNISETNGKALYIWSQSNNNDKEIRITIQETFGRGDKMDIMNINLKKK